MEAVGGFGPELDRLGRDPQGSPVVGTRRRGLFDLRQVTEAVAGGADAILLIVAALAVDDLHALHEQATRSGLGVLVEVHDAAELRIAAELSPPDGSGRMIGINNRDLATLRVDVRRTFELLPGVPAGSVIVGESGLRSAADLMRLREAGVHAVLIGEALMRAPDIEDACRTLTGAPTMEG